MTKILPFEKLGGLKKKYAGRTIVHCHGVFDLFHYGHLLHLASAKKMGDILVVTVTPDRFVNKGPGRPRYSERQRAMMLASLDVVDHVAINVEPRASAAIRAIAPDLYVKGSEYRDRQKDITGGISDEESAVRKAGGRLAFTNDEVLSSTELLNRYFTQRDATQTEALDQVRRALPLAGVIKVIDSLEGMKVTVVGEPIVDTYVFCHAENISTKSPTVSARFLNQEDYAGGSLAIANHLRALGCRVRLLIPHGGEPYFKDLLRSSVSKGIDVESVVLPGTPTPRKTRYLTPFKTQRMFELTNLPSDPWEKHDHRPFAKKLLAAARDSEVLVAADFGHGAFEGPVTDALESAKGFVALNVQTNSGNYGYNLFTKHRRYDYISIDERELRLGMHDRRTPVVDLARKAVKEKIRRTASITLGTAGSLYFDSRRKESLCPSFFNEPIDTTGAGDAYFAITSLLVRRGVPPPIIPFLGNCFAGLKTRIIGNKSAVAKVDMIRTVQSILK